MINLGNQTYREMKKLICIASGLLLPLLLHAQTISVVTNKDIKLTPKTAINLPKAEILPTATLSFKINDMAEGESVIINVKDSDEGTATGTTDYVITGLPLTDKSIKYNANNIFSFDIKTITKKKTTVIISISCVGIKTSTYKLVINLNADVRVISDTTDASKDPGIIPDTGRWDVRIITGGNFDFFNGPRIKDFAGEMNIVTPDIINLKLFGKDVPFGLQFGLFNYHYFQADSSNSFNGRDQYYLNPQDAYRPYDSTKIVNRNYSVNRKVDYNIWGVYLEPTFRFAKNDFAAFYLSLHFGALITTQRYSPTVTYTTRDTINYNPKINTTIPQSNILAHPAVPYSYKQTTFYDYYYGIGFPLKINMKNKLKFNITQTIGFASIQSAVTQDSFDYTQRFSSTGPPRDIKGFYLAKYQIITTVAPIDIAFGGEYRAVFGNLHYFTNYIGAVVSLDKLKK